MDSGDMVHFCKDGHCVEVIFKSSSHLGCTVELEGSDFLVDCENLQQSCDDVVSDVNLSEGQRVLVRFNDEFASVVRVWPATIKAVHSNGNVSVYLDGMGGRVSLSSDNIVPLSTRSPNVN